MLRDDKPSYIHGHVASNNNGLVQVECLIYGNSEVVEVFEEDLTDVQEEITLGLKSY